MVADTVSAIRRIDVGRLAIRRVFDIRVQQINQRSSENPYRGFQTTFLYRVGINSQLTESRLSFSNFTIPRIDSPIGVV